MVADKLREASNPVLMIGGREIGHDQGMLLSRIGKACGARVMSDTFPARWRRCAGSAVIERLPYLAEMAVETLKDADVLVTIGCAAPVSFFAYPNVPSAIAPDSCEQLQLAGPCEDIGQALETLGGLLGAADHEPEVYPLQPADAPSGDLDAMTAGATLAHFLPENAIVVDEGATSSIACFPMTTTARPHDWLNLTGGSIGWGLPAAVGAAIACPDRKVVCLEGDGSAMYTIQSLWTMARENLDVCVVLFNNRKYSILELEFSRTGARGGTPGPKAASVLDIGSPEMDFTAMAQGMGVAATRATTAEEFNEQFSAAMAHKGPCLIDCVLPTFLS